MDGTPAISQDEVNVKFKAANKTLHEGVHQTLLQLVHTTRNSILKKEIIASQKTLMMADPNEWQAYVYDRVGTSNQDHQIHSQLAQIQAEIAQLDVFHSVLEGHRATIEGIENKAHQKSARTIANEQALATFHNKVMPIKQNDQTIFEAIARRAQLDVDGKQAKIDLEREVKEIEDDCTMHAD